MTIPQLPININMNPTPTIFEQQTSGRVDAQNRAESGKGNVVIVPQSDTDIVPFTKLAERNTWNYKSESGRPSLPPAFTSRGAPGSPEDKSSELTAANYNQLQGQLPEGLKNDMKDYPTPLTVGFEGVLKQLAAGFVWQESVKVMLNSENSTNRMQANLRYPDGSFANTVVSGREFVETALKLLDEIGPNDPHYLEVKSFVDSVNTDLTQLKEGSPHDEH